MSKQLDKGTVLINRYEIYRILGQGGFGTTYSARDMILSQDVVIKEYYPNDEKGMQRFLNEAQRQASIFEVQGVVKVLDFFESENAGYIIMEYVKGIPLAEWIQRMDEPYTFEDAWALIRPVAEALEKIHQKGMIHRDISSDNLMVTEDGSLKLLDFGAAREFCSEEEYEKTMTVMVKEGYAPPEQYYAKGSQGPWSDVYALCAVMYEMMTSSMPPNSLERQLSDQLYALSAYGADIMPEIEEVFLKRGMALEPEERWQSMTEMKKALEGEAETESAGLCMWKKLLILAAVILLIVAGVLLIKDDSRPESLQTVAGSYDRGSEKYEEFIGFVKENAVTQEADPEDESAVIYTLDKDAVMQWGEPCNVYQEEIIHEELTDALKDQGHSLEKVKSSDDITVTTREYGIIETNFLTLDKYMCDDNIDLALVYDIVSGRLARLVISIDPGVDADISGLAGDVLLLVNEDADVNREEAGEICREWMEYCRGVEGGAFSGIEMDNGMSYGCRQSDGFETDEKLAFVLDAAGVSYYWP